MNDPGEPWIIEAQDIHKSYLKASKVVRVLTGASLKVRRGEMLGLVGASGAGKSTFLHILGGLDHPQSGRVLFEGTNIFDQGERFLDGFRNRRIGFVFQLFNLLGDFTALENTLLPALIARRNPKTAREEAEALLVRVGLKDRMQHKPGELSGGECQRVALARSLINRPALLLADEPTGNLDAHSSEALMQLIRELNQEYGQTFVIVTHSKKIAERLDRILELAEGIVQPARGDLVL